MNVLSLFDGMSCGMIALERAGIEVTNYYSSEIDKYASIVSDKNYPEIKRLGCITKHDDWDLPEIDLLIAGFPCQAWSLAGKQKGDNDPRGALVHDLIEIWKKYKPKYFMFENVKMKKEFLEYINGLFNVEPILINSALVSAQNRNRYYWTNIPDIEQPEDKGVLLKDIIETGNFISLEETTYTIRCKKQIHKNGKFSDQKAVAVCTNSNMTGSGVNVLKEFVDRDKPVLVMKARGNNPGGLRAVNGKTPAMSSSSWQDNFHLTTEELADKIFTNEYKYRKLTPIECERLQTIPDNYTNHVSNTQRYKMIGNGWTVDVIAHIFKGLKW